MGSKRGQMKYRTVGRYGGEGASHNPRLRKNKVRSRSKELRGWAEVFFQTLTFLSGLLLLAVHLGRAAVSRKKDATEEQGLALDAVTIPSRTQGPRRRGMTRLQVDMSRIYAPTGS